LFSDGESIHGFSSAEEDELVEQMEQEQAEHVRFAAELNNKTEEQSRKDFEKELKQLRAQQRKDKQAADEVSETMVTECQALLRLFGIPYITAPMEAEAQCADLVRLGLVDGIVTDDSDIFLFGGTRVYKNMFSNNKFVECYLGQDLERDLSLSRDQLIALAQLLGSDYTEGLPGVGPVTAVELVAEFPGTGGLDEFKEWWKDVQSGNRPKDADATSPFRRKFRKSHGKKLFLPTGFPSPAVTKAYLNPAVDDNSETFQWGLPDVEGLRQFLMSTIGWDKERTDEVLLPVVKDMNRREAEGTQSNITRYFQGGIGAGAAGEGFAPRERVKKSKRMGDAVAKLKQKTLVASSVVKPASKAGLARGKKGRKRAAPVDPVEEGDDFVDYDELDGSISEVEESDESEKSASATRRRNRGKRTKT
jgi:DNA excision repair protein ERCC-5